ncbi:MAG: hypothetical protein ACK5LO_02395 [Leucobacter sp.]
MIAYARIALDAQVPKAEQSVRDLTQYEKVTLSGEGASWVEDQAAVPLPAGCLVLAWAAWPI